jgi:serine protease
MRYIGPEAFGPESTQTLFRLTGIDGVPCAFNSGTYDIAARMTVAENVFVDGDVNDPKIEEVPNDLDSASAQQLVPPARVAGFVTADPTGVEGDRFEDEADDWDVYILAMREGEGLTLTVADWNPENKQAVDLDLYLIDVNDTENVLASSLTTDEQEVVLAPFGGNFFVFVNAYAGQSNYLLQSGQSGQVSSSTMDITTEFVPDQVMASVHDSHSLETASKARQHVSRIEKTEAQLSLNRLSESHADEVLYEIAHPSVLTLAPHPLTLAGYGSITPEQWRVIRTAKALSANPDYRWAGPNYLNELYAEPNDSFYQFQWHYDTIRLPEAWDITRGSEEVIVAVLDSGVYDHPDLASNVNYALGYDFVDDLILAGDGDGIDSDARDPGKKYPLYDPYISHGTHVAGTIGARTNNNIGVSGVNWNVEIMPVRVCGISGSCGCWSQLQGLRWAGRLDNESGLLPANAADIVNMSLGGASRCPGREEIINQLASSGTIVIAAAGNEGNIIPNYPASLANVVSVSATTIADRLANYSSFGSTVDIAAPGGDKDEDLNNDSFSDGVLSNLMIIEEGSSQAKTGYLFLPGTSMAAPHVAGVAALMKSVYPGLGPSQFRTAMTSGQITVDLAQNGATNKDSSFGYGRIDALKAVQWAVEADRGQETNAFMTSSISALDFSSDVQSIDVLVEKAGSGTLSVSGVGWTEGWTTVSSVSVDSNGFGRYQVAVDRGGLIDGQYAAWIAFDGSDGSRLWVSVLMRVGQSVAGEAGYVYALILDQWTLSNLKEWEGAQRENGFDIQLDDLPPGTYYLLVSTDLDRDRIVCDDGELCELYPGGSLVEPIRIENADVELSTFSMGFPTLQLKSSDQSASALSNSMRPEEPSFDRTIRLGVPLRR